MRFTLSLLLLFFTPLFMMGQAPVAAFSANVTSGCSPLTVLFKDESTGSPKSWNWDFGNNVLSTQQNPAISFPVGTYTITLVVRNADGISSVTKTNFIVANPSPSADYSVDKVLTCLPGNIKFTDQSVANAGTLTNWNWNFGDGTTSTLQNPQHTYANPGFYDVYLNVVSSTGCQGAISRGRYIRIVNGVKADFNYTGPSTCTTPYVLNYQNLTSGPGNLTYTWDLGNGNSSSLAAPTASYNTSGTYTIKLTATSEYGCSDATQKSVAINGVTTSMTSSADSVCLGSGVSFQNNSSATPVKTLWNFGDGTTSALLSPPAKIYTSPGTYTVKVVNTYSNCSDSATRVITVNPTPVLNFSMSHHQTCKLPLTVNFLNQSPDVTGGILWNFGDGNTSTLMNPSHTYTGTGNSTFIVSVTIKDKNGCSRTRTTNDPDYGDNIYSLPPSVHMSSATTGICLGSTYTPDPFVGTEDGEASRLWDYDDGTLPTAVNSHTYTATGFYAVKLVVTTNDGCKDSFLIPNAVQVGNHPTVDFSGDKLNACHSDSVTFTNLTTPAGSTVVLWNFGDSSVSTLPGPKHRFTDTGFHTIKLVVVSNGCTDSTSKTNYTHVLPPVANFGYGVPDCNNRTSVVFTDSSATNTAYTPLAYQWSFGDGSPVNTTVPPATVLHTFPAAGSYNVQLVVTNGACKDSVTKPVTLLISGSSFNFNKPSAIYCRNENITLTCTNPVATVKKYEWVIDGGAPVTITNSATYNISSGVTGNHTVMLTVTDINNCVTVTGPKTFTITGPTASFTVPGNGGCKNSNIVFTDASIPNGSIAKWTYDFGDGSPAQLFTAPPFSHKYADTGIYSIKLTILDTIGCVDSFRLSTAATITRPSAYFTALQTSICPGIPLQFIDSSRGQGLNYNWNLGDGNISSTQNPSHQYSGTDSSYTVKLVITDKYGCQDSLTRTNYINVKSPKLLFSVKDTTSICPPLETKFNFSGSDYESFNWDFGDGGSSSLASTSHFYNAYGKYTAKLYVTGFGGCTDSSSVNITVTNPLTNSTIIFNSQPACNELTVNFTIIPPYSTRYKFDFGDGEIDSSQKTQIQHTFTVPNTYYPTILLIDSVGCQFVVGGQGNVVVLGAIPLFGMDKKKFCDSGAVYFADYSQDGQDKIVTRTWDFGDGTTSVLTKDAIHTYTQPGLYLPTLKVTTQSPCSQTFTDTVRVLATPTPVITSAAGVCDNGTINFAASLLIPPDTAIAWKWSLANGQTSTSRNVSVTYTDTGVHHIVLEASNSLGCKRDTSKDIVVYPLPSIGISGDTSFISGGVGLTMPLTYSANTVSYNWTPPGFLSCTDCANPFANPKFTTTYTVNVTDANGCANSRNITVVVACNEKNIFIPNTFSPNNDGVNDRFYPRGTGLNMVQAMRIFNRWGEMVFEKRNFPANDALSGWDGTYNGKAVASDAYIYLIDIICENATIITNKGTITLIR